MLGVSLTCLAAPQGEPPAAPSAVKVIEVKQPDGQILSYRFGSASADVRMRGTSLDSDAQIRLKVGSRPGFVEIDINRGAITGLKPAHEHGRDFLTYVLWAVSVDGKASNLGEITFDGAQPISINVTTPYQTFWLMLTAEPDYAVVDPSPQVVMYSAGRGTAEAPSDRALTIKGDLFYFTHYTSYDTSPGTPESAPNELLQARKAVELASKTGVLAAGSSPRLRLREEERTRRTLEQAKSFLEQAEGAYRKDPRGREVVQFARTASQIAENARALARGAVGGVLVRQLEEEVARLRAENNRLRAESQPAGGPGEAPAEAQEPPAESPPTQPANASEPDPPLVARPVVWFGFVGWILALLLMFRRRNG